MNPPPALRVAFVEPSMYPSFQSTMEANPAIELVAISPDTPDEQALAVLATCQGYYVRATRDELAPALHVHRELLRAAPSLLMVASYGAGYDTVDAAACTEAGVAAINQSGGNATAVAQHALGMMLALVKRIPEADRAMRAGTVGARTAFMGHELFGRTVGLVGIGHVGREVATLLGAFGCRVLATDPFVDAPECTARGAQKVDLDTLLQSADIVSVHCPLNEDTRGMLGADAFARMRQGSWLVSTARGSIHDEGALHAALASGHLAGAGLDVWELEPPPKTHPLLALDNVIVSPHIAGITHESRDRIARIAAEAFIEVASGNLPPRVVNPAVTERFLERLGAWRAGSQN